MFTRQERYAFIILGLVTLAVFSASLVLESLGKGAFSTRYSSVSPDGTLVFLEGKVEKMSVTKTGGNTILSLNGTSVFIPGPVASDIVLQVGDTISVYGIVQTYRGEKEVQVAQVRDITVLYHKPV